MHARWSVRRCLWIAVALGVVCRLVQYAWRRSYWHDESYLVLNLIDGRPSDAFGPLRHYQSAPPLFLWIEFGIKTLAGVGEYALRAVPLLLGCVSVGLFAVLARRVASPTAAVMATMLFALSDRLIWHSVEAKQYSSDVFVALLLLLAATARGGDTRRLLTCAVIASVGVWLSHPTVFVFGGIVLALATTKEMREEAQDRRQETGEEDFRPARGSRFSALLSSASALLSPVFLAANAAVVASFGVLYFTSARHQQYPYLFEYWARDMVPWARPLQVLPWLVRQSIGLFDYPYDGVGPLLLAMGGVGAVALWRSGRRRILGLLLGPVAVTLLASALHRYPFAGTRVTLFLSPAVLLLGAIGVGACVTAASAKARWRPVAYVLPGALIAWGLLPAVYDLFVPRHNGHIRPVAEYAQARRVGEEPVYVLGETEPLDCYWRGPGVGVQSTPESLPHVGDSSFWVLYAYSTRRGEKSRRDAVRATAERVPIVDHHDVPGGAAFRFAAAPAVVLESDR